MSETSVARQREAMMGRLIVDHQFVGFSEEVGRQIFRSSRRKLRHQPRCTNGGEPFGINGVRSIGSSHQVRRRADGCWIKLVHGAVIEWLSPDGVYGSDVLAEQLSGNAVADARPGSSLHRIHIAVERLEEAGRLVDEAARQLWGLKEFESEHEYLVKDSRLLDIARKKIKQRFAAVAEAANPLCVPESAQSKRSEVCPCCGGAKEVGLAFCSETCFAKLPKELRKALKTAVGAPYEDALGRALQLLRTCAANASPGSAEPAGINGCPSTEAPLA